jgi:hypothetical protein
MAGSNPLSFLLRFLGFQILLLVLIPNKQANAAQTDECLALGPDVFECAKRAYYQAVNVYCKCCRSVGDHDYVCVLCFSVNNEDKLALELPGRKRCIPRAVLGKTHGEGADEKGNSIAKG